MAKRKRVETKQWRVPYERTMRGAATVEAATATEAEDSVNVGDFEHDPGEEMVDWKTTGTAKEDQ